ncbi:MAG TPA: glycosyltransferase family 9 protein [Verrucomicrobiota bacterium]|nr:glycosyltransferase family 9 protein [Verrucomicrobiota bacterium]HNU50135.1 glycosyltransferase family 9 protein [Verrucomicrobiota bacterium]
MSQILVIRGGAIGDFILTLPVLAALRAAFPTARLEVLGYAHIAELARSGGLADGVRAIDSRALAGFFADGGDLDDAMADYFASFAVILSYLYDPDAVFRLNVARCSPAQFIQGPHRPDESGGQHATQALLKPLERLAIWDADPSPRLALEPDTGAGPAESNAGAVQLALHPGSGSERKNWPENRWAELLQRLAGKPEIRLLLVGGEAEGSRIDRLAAMVPANRVETACHWPLPVLARRLAACDGFVGHDSGITHLAAAVGLPGLVLWGDSIEAIWRPSSPRMRVLRDPAGLGHLPVDRVLEAVESLVAGLRVCARTDSGLAG